MVDPRFACEFPGQGSQSPSMLADLAAAFTMVDQTFAEVSEGVGLDVWSICSATDDPRLNQTEFTQPVLLAGGVAIGRVREAQGGSTPAQLSGHSPSEYSALVAASALMLGDSARPLRERGRLRQDAMPAGEEAMAAVLGAEDALVAEVCAAAAGTGVVSPASPDRL